MIPNDIHNDGSIWALLAARLTGEDSEKERQALEEWLGQNPEGRRFIECFTAMWRYKPDIADNKKETEAAFEKHWKKIVKLEADKQTRPAE